MAWIWPSNRLTSQGYLAEFPAKRNRENIWPNREFESRNRELPLPTGYGTTREQRCWVHKTAHVLNKLPKGVQPRAKQHLQDIWMAETKEVAEKAFAP